MAADPETDPSAPSTHDCEDTDEALSERGDDARARRRSAGSDARGGERKRATASLHSSPSFAPMSPAAHSNGPAPMMHSSTPSSPTTASPASRAALHSAAAPRAPRDVGFGAAPAPAACPTSLRAGGRLFGEGAGVGSCKRPSMRTSAPLRRDYAAELKLAKHAALLQAASLAAARIATHGGELTPHSPGTGAAKLEWHAAGNEYVGRHVLRCVYDGAALAGMARATVIGWLPATESDFEDALGRPQPLWLVRFVSGSLLAGEEEELELHELVESLDADEADGPADFALDDADAAAPLRGDSALARDDGDGAPHDDDDAHELEGLPGWVTEKRQLLNGRTYDVYRGPHGVYADSYTQAAAIAGVDYGGLDDGGLGGAGAAGGRRGKRRCGQCSTCKAEDCNACKFCRDKAKNGGANTLRRPCSARQACLAPPQDDATMPAHAHDHVMMPHLYEHTAIMAE